jgi:hypothetical protein
MRNIVERGERGVFDQGHLTRMASANPRARAYLDRSDARPIDPVFLPLRDAEFSTPILGGIFSAHHDAGPLLGRLLIERLYGPQCEPR